MTSYQKIKMKATLYKLAANQNDAPVYRVIDKGDHALKTALKAVKDMLVVMKGGKK